jgi:hypothetical protein
MQVLGLRFQGLFKSPFCFALSLGQCSLKYPVAECSRLQNKAIYFYLALLYQILQTADDNVFHTIYY